VGDLGVPKVKKAELTIPESPHLTKNKGSIKAEEPTYKPFKANPYVPVAHTATSTKVRAPLHQPVKPVHVKKLPEQAPPDFHRLQPTVPKSPALSTKQRGQHYRQMFKERLEMQRQREAEQKVFHATPVPEVMPFMPTPSEKPPTRAQDVRLNTEERAQERHIYEEELKERECMMEVMKLQHEEALKQQEADERRRLRKMAEFKARPAPKM
jgi:hypothetical protein